MQIESIIHKYIHAYIHNWSLQPFSQGYDLALNTTYVVCVNFIHEWRDLQFKADSERQSFKDFHYNLRVFVWSLLSDSRRRSIFFIFLVVGDV